MRSNAVGMPFVGEVGGVMGFDWRRRSSEEARRDALAHQEHTPGPDGRPRAPRPERMRR